MSVGGATVRFRWSFSELAARRAKITQKITLSGEGAAELVEPAKGLELTVPDGMKRIAERIARSWTETHSGKS